MIQLTQNQISDIAFEFTDKSGRRCGSTFTIGNEWLLNPQFPVSDEFHEKKLYICKTPEIAKERLEVELNDWLKNFKEDI